MRHDPSGGNFGHLFTDKANSLLLNQAVLTVQRPLDPKATGYDFGFKVQAMYGSDARYTHFLGEFDESISGRNQFDFVEAHALFHLPWFTSGGMDVKVGQYVTLEGAEVIYAPDNSLYSHSYIFNFGIPFKHTGIMTTTHVNSMARYLCRHRHGREYDVRQFVQLLHVWGQQQGRRVPWRHGAQSLNGALTILATTHIGPENPNVSAVVLAGVNPNRDLRYLNDVTIIWKATDKLTLTTDLNYIRDDGFKATGGGVAQYFAYTINDWLKIVGRGEIWRDRQRLWLLLRQRLPGQSRFRQIRTRRSDSGSNRWDHYYLWRAHSWPQHHTHQSCKLLHIGLDHKARDLLRYVDERHHALRRWHEEFAIHVWRRHHHTVQD